MDKRDLRYKPLPPYGRELLKRAQIAAEIWLFLGAGAWHSAKHHHAMGKSVLVLPEHKSPQEYHWPVKQIPVLVFDLSTEGASEMLLKQLAWQLLSDEAAIVRLISASNSGSISIFRRVDCLGFQEIALCH